MTNNTYSHWRLLFFFIFTSTVTSTIAQDACIEFTNGERNGSQICSPTSKLIFQFGDKPYFEVRTGLGSKRVVFTVTQESGFRNNLDDPISEAEMVHNYDKKVDECRVQLNRNALDMCGRTGDFSFKIEIHHRATRPGFPCDTKHTTSYSGKFEILPDATIGVSTAEKITEIVCPGNNIPLSVDANAPNQDGAIWFDLNDNFIADSYSITTDIQTLEIQNFKVAYYRLEKGEYNINDGAGPQTIPYECVAMGLKIPFVAVAVDLDSEPSPPNIVEILCKPDSLEINLPNPNDEYSTVNWYSDAARTKLLHTGFSYSDYFHSTANLFTEYVKDYGSCKKKSALPGTVTVYVAEKDINNNINVSEILTSKNHVIFDYRDFDGANCTSAPKFYADISLNEQSITDFTVPAPSTGVSEIRAVSGSFWTSQYVINEDRIELRDGETYNGFTADLYLEDGNNKYVCADHIGKYKSEYGTRRYYQYSQVDFKYFVQIDGTPFQQSHSCPVAKKNSVTVQTRPINESNPDEVCLPTTEEMVSEVNSGLLNDCHRVKVRNICPGDNNITLGPDENEIFDTYVGAGGSLPPEIVKIKNSLNRYSWTPITGLDNPNNVNPKTTFDSAGGEEYEFFKYTLNISYPEGTEAKYCEILYKCSSCGPLEEPLGTLNSLNN